MILYVGRICLEKEESLTVLGFYMIILYVHQHRVSSVYSCHCSCASAMLKFTKLTIEQLSQCEFWMNNNYAVSATNTFILFV